MRYHHDSYEVADSAQRTYEQSDRTAPRRRGFFYGAALMKKNELLVIYGKHYTEMAESLCARAGLSSMILEKCGSRSADIAIKPNILGPIPAKDGATTHPEVVRGIIRYLRSEGFERITVMESSWVGDKTSDSLLVTGFGELCEELDVPFVDLQKDSSVKRDCAGMELNICSRPLQADFLINVPVLKGHCQTRMTCALKNMKGCIPSSEKRRFHRMGLHEPIGHLAAGIRQDFILVDSICGDLTFEDGGNPVPQDRMIAAVDPVLCDAYGCSLIGIPIEEVRYIAVAEACGAGSSDLSRASVRCLREAEDRPQDEENISGIERSAAADDDMPQAEEEEAYKEESAAAVSASLIRVRELVDEVDSCSACYANLLPAIRRLEQEGLAEYLKDRVCIGQGFRGKSGELGVGECTGYFRNNVPGCPPDTERSYRYLKEYCEKQKSLCRG